MNNKKAFSVVAALKFGFVEFIEHLFFFIKLGLIQFGVYAAFALGCLAISGLIGLLKTEWFWHIREIPNVYQHSQKVINVVLGSPFIGFAVTVFFMGFTILRIFLNLGLRRIALDIYDADSSKISQLFSQVSKVATAWLTALVYAGICFLGMLFFVLPGIFFGVMFSLYEYVIVDQDRGVFEALKESYRLMSKDKVSVFSAIIALFLIYFLGGPISLLLLGQVWNLMYAFMYRRLQAADANNME